MKARNVPGSVVGICHTRRGREYKGQLKHNTTASFAIIWKMRVLLDKIWSLVASSGGSMELFEETNVLLSAIEARVNNRLVFQPINDVLVDYLWSDAFEIDYDLDRIEYNMLKYQRSVPLEDLESILYKMELALQLLSDYVDHVILRRRRHVLNIQQQAIGHVRRSRMPSSRMGLQQQEGQSGLENPLVLSRLGPMGTAFAKRDTHKGKKDDKELASRWSVLLGSEKQDGVNKQTPSQMKEAIVQQFLQKGHDGIYVVPLILNGLSNEVVLSSDSVYNDLSVQEQFNLRIWVNLSNQCPMVNSTESISNTIFKLINSHVVNKENHLPPVHSREFRLWLRNPKCHQQKEDNNQAIIRKGVAAKKFLLVLHDMSEDQTAQLEDLFEALQHGSKSSKIIVTSRSSGVVDSLIGVNILESNVVEEIRWRFFRNNAFCGVNTKDYPLLVDLGKDTARLLKRFPLAMKMIGRMLNTNLHMIYWCIMFYNIKYILEEHKAASEQYQLLSLLKLCYDQLPAPVGMCFHCCCLFPKDWTYRPQELMNIWISEGIILPKKHPTETDSVTTIVKPKNKRQGSSQVESTIPDNSAVEQYPSELIITSSKKRSPEDKFDTSEKEREREGFVGLDQKGKTFILRKYISFVGKHSIDDTISTELDDESIEDVCRGYFNELYTRGFFELLTTDVNSSYYVMHSFIHYLAEVVSRRMKFVRLDGSWQPKEISEVFHLSIRSTNLPVLSSLLNIEPKPTSLRTFIVYGPLEPKANEILGKFLKEIYNIRTLDLAGCGMKGLPKFKYQVRQSLRYLGLRDTGIEALPEEFDQYLHLQVLNVEGCQLRSLPYEVIGLHNLRHIIGPASLISSIRWIGKLENLQELEEFRIRKEHGYEVSQLGYLLNLGGSLSITNLENVCSADEARKAALHLKRRLFSLKLEQCSTHKEGPQPESAEILDCLQPPSSIKELEINGYVGNQCPRWFTESHISHVRKITLRNCTGFILLPCFTSMPGLEVLTLQSLPSVERIVPGSDSASYSHRFPRLVELTIEDLPSLEEWREHEPCFPCLRRFTIRHCPKLTMLPPLSLDKLTNMQVEGVSLSSFNPCKTEPSIPEAQVTDISKTSFKEDDCSTFEPSKMLVVRDCPNLSTFTIPDDASNGFLVPLVQLEIIDCNHLKIIEGALYAVESFHIERCHKFINLPDGKIMTSLCILHIDNVSGHMMPFLVDLPSLKELIVKDSPELESLDVLLESHHLWKTLKRFHLINCETMKSLPGNMEQLSALESLHLKQCSKISRLPDLPDSLDELHICNCPLLKERCNEFGPDWDKISYIPYLFVDWE